MYLRPNRRICGGAFQGRTAPGGGRGGDERSSRTHTTQYGALLDATVLLVVLSTYLPFTYGGVRVIGGQLLTYIHTTTEDAPFHLRNAHATRGRSAQLGEKGGGGGGLFFILFLFLWFFFSSGKRIKLRKEKKKKKSPTAGRRPTPIPLHSTPLHDLNVVRTGREEEGGWKDGWKEERKDGRMEGRMHRTFPFPPADSCDVETPRRMQS